MRGAKLFGHRVAGPAGFSNVNDGDVAILRRHEQLIAISVAFKHCCGVTVFDYLREERMKEARRLLSESTLDIGAIALAIGYSNTANFSTAFRDRFGMPPSQFRR